MHIRDALTFDDVLIRPKRSTLVSRSDVDLVREFKFRHAEGTWSGIPIVAANMDTTGLFSIVIKSRKKSSVIAFVNSLKLFGIGYSWGGFESLAILQEIKSSKKDEYLKGRQFYRFKKDEHIVRLHIGLEDTKDLINDLKQGLKKIR